MNYKDSENLKTVMAPMNILKYTVIESQKKSNGQQSETEGRNTEKRFPLEGN